jgi:hypothetical protein
MWSNWIGYTLPCKVTYVLYVHMVNKQNYGHTFKNMKHLLLFQVNNSYAKTHQY